MEAGSSQRQSFKGVIVAPPQGFRALVTLHYGPSGRLDPTARASAKNLTGCSCSSRAEAAAARDVLELWAQGAYGADPATAAQLNFPLVHYRGGSGEGSGEGSGASDLVSLVSGFKTAGEAQALVKQLRDSGRLRHIAQSAGADVTSSGGEDGGAQPGGAKRQPAIIGRRRKREPRVPVNSNPDTSRERGRSRNSPESPPAEDDPGSHPPPGKRQRRRRQQRSLPPPRQPPARRAKDRHPTAATLVAGMSEEWAAGEEGDEDQQQQEEEEEGEMWVAEGRRTRKGSAAGSSRRKRMRKAAQPREALGEAGAGAGTSPQHSSSSAAGAWSSAECSPACSGAAASGPAGVLVLKYGGADSWGKGGEEEAVDNAVQALFTMAAAAASATDTRAAADLNTSRAQAKPALDTPAQQPPSGQPAGEAQAAAAVAPAGEAAASEPTREVAASLPAREAAPSLAVETAAGEPARVAATVTEEEPAGEADAGGLPQRSMPFPGEPGPQVGHLAGAEGSAEQAVAVVEAAAVDEEDPAARIMGLQHPRRRRSSSPARRPRAGGWVLPAPAAAPATSPAAGYGAEPLAANWQQQWRRQHGEEDVLAVWETGHAGLGLDGHGRAVATAGVTPLGAGAGVEQQTEWESLACGEDAASAMTESAPERSMPWMTSALGYLPGQEAQWFGPSTTIGSYASALQGPAGAAALAAALQRLPAAPTTPDALRATAAGSLSTGQGYQGGQNVGQQVAQQGAQQGEELAQHLAGFKRSLQLLQEATFAAHMAAAAATAQQAQQQLGTPQWQQDVGAARALGTEPPPRQFSGQHSTWEGMAEGGGASSHWQQQQWQQPGHQEQQHHQLGEQEQEQGLGGRGSGGWESEHARPASAFTLLRLGSPTAVSLQQKPQLRMQRPASAPKLLRAPSPAPATAATAAARASASALGAAPAPGVGFRSGSSASGVSRRSPLGPHPSQPGAPAAQQGQRAPLHASPFMDAAQRPAQRAAFAPYPRGPVTSKPPVAAMRIQPPAACRPPPVTTEQSRVCAWAHKPGPSMTSSVSGGQAGGVGSRGLAPVITTLPPTPLKRQRDDSGQVIEVRPATDW